MKQSAQVALHLPMRANCGEPQSPSILRHLIERMVRISGGAWLSGEGVGIYIGRQGVIFVDQVRVLYSIVAEDTETDRLIIDLASEACGLLDQEAVLLEKFAVTGVLASSESVVVEPGANLPPGWLT